MLVEAAEARSMAVGETGKNALTKLERRRRWCMQSGRGRCKMKEVPEIAAAASVVQLRDALGGRLVLGLVGVVWVCAARPVPDDGSPARVADRTLAAGMAAHTVAPSTDHQVACHSYVVEVVRRDPTVAARAGHRSRTIAVALDRHASAR